MRRSVLVAFVLAAISVWGLAACGRGAPLSKDDYIARVRSALEPIKETRAQADAAARAKSSDELADVLREAEATYRDAGSKLDDIEPPNDVADLHEELVKAVSKFGDTTADTQDAADSGNEKGLALFRRSAARFRHTLAALLRLYASKDYEFDTR